MKYSFTCYGHENITATHKTTLEFTKDENLGLEGDCIVGVKADFSLLQLKKFIKSLNNRKITITIETMNNINNKNNINKKIKINKNKIINNKIVEKINAEVNPDFDDDKEIIIRKTDFVSERTFAIKADKAAFELNNELIMLLKDKDSKIAVIIENNQK